MLSTCGCHTRSSDALESFETCLGLFCTFFQFLQLSVVRTVRTLPPTVLPANGALACEMVALNFKLELVALHTGQGGIL